jgi:DNA invertase Pin-like site-specific DNA recombinase
MTIAAVTRNTTVRAALYARISDDESDGYGVERQLADMRAHADRNGWHAVEYCDDKRSASRYAKKRRENFDRMLHDVRAGQVDVIVVPDLSRYTRQPRIVEDLIDLSEAGTVKLVTLTGGPVDTRYAEGKARLRHEATFAAQYSDFVSDKVRRKKQELVSLGVGAGGTRPFGYRGRHQITAAAAQRSLPGQTTYDDKTGTHFMKAGQVLDTTEANAIRQAVTDVLTGTSLSDIARRWNAAGFTTPRLGSQWSVPSVHMVLTNPRNAGRVASVNQRQGNRRTYTDIGPAVWETIISTDELKAITARLNDPNRKHKTPSRRTLLTGLVKCQCGQTMVSNGIGRDELRCKRLPESPKRVCGKNMISRSKLEELVTDEILDELDSARFRKLVATEQRRRARVTRDNKHTRVDIEAEIADLDQAVKAGAWNVRDAAPIRMELLERLAAVDAEPAEDLDLDVLAKFVDGDVRKEWGRRTVDQQRRVIATMVESITVKRGTGWDEDRITLVGR